MVTTGSSAAFVLGFLAMFDAGDRVAVARPGYPCYVNILEAMGVEVVSLPVDARTNFQPTVEMLEDQRADGADVNEDTLSAARAMMAQTKKALDEVMLQAGG